jgi:hypothetical protein
MTDSTILAGASTLFTLLLGLATYALKYAIDQRDKEVDRRLKDREDLSKEHDSDLKVVSERLRQEEMKSIRLEGDLKLQSQAHNGLTDDMDSIKNNMVSRQEWESRMASVERTLQQILAQITSSRSSGGYRSVPDSGDKPTR